MRLFNVLKPMPWAITSDAFQLLLDVYAEALRRKAMDEKIDWNALAEKKGVKIRETAQCELREDGVAVINVIGPIFRRADWFTEMCGVCSTESMAYDFNKVLASDDVRAILWNIDSPGGEATGIAELARMIYSARGKKPMMSYNDGMMCSGGLWIGAAAGPIRSDRIALTGSIGVVAQIQDFSEQEAMMGIKTYKFRSTQSPNKNLDVATQEGQDAIQRTIDDIAAVFVSDMALMLSTEDNRLTSQDVIDNFGGGAVFVGQRAKKVGLIEGLSTQEECIDRLLKDAKAKKNQVFVTSQTGGAAVQAAANSNILDENLEVDKVVADKNNKKTTVEEENAAGGETTETKPVAEKTDEAENAQETPKTEDQPTAEQPKQEDKPEEESAAATTASVASSITNTAHQPSETSAIGGVVQISAAELAELRAKAGQADTLQVSLISERAEKRASELVHEGRINPSHKPNVQAFVQHLMEADEKTPVNNLAVSFNADGKVEKTGSRVDAFLACLPDAGTMAGSTHTKETIPTVDLSSAKETEELGDDEQRRVEEAKKRAHAYGTQVNEGLKKTEAKATGTTTK